MVALHELDNYTSSEIEFLTRRAPVIKHYLELLQNYNFKTEIELLHKKRLSTWVQCAFASVFQKNTPQEICFHWSAVADEIIKSSWTLFELDHTTLSLFALGKLGAKELNLSSDLDLFIISPDDNLEIAEDLKKIKKWIKALTENTSLGFLFRLDFDLRAGGSSSPLITSLTQWTTHYGYFGETWDRMAFVRLRPLVENTSISPEVLMFASKYAFRRHLDFTLLPTLKQIKAKLRKQHREEPETNLKFAQGGIRELELFVNALQIIHGGKVTSLKTSSLTAALKEIDNNGILPSNDCKTLNEAYWLYRNLENILQGCTDHHSYDISQLPSIDLIPQGLIEQYYLYKTQVAHMINEFLGEEEQVTSEASDLELQAITKQKWENLFSLKIPGKDSELRFEEKNIFLKKFAQKLTLVNVDNNLAIENLVDFINKTKVKSSLFSLFIKHEALIDELVWVFSVSPSMAQTLCQRPELLDLFLLKNNKSTFSIDDETMLEELRDEKLVNEIISIGPFLKNQNIELLLQNQSDMADKIAKTLFSRLFKNNPNLIDIVCLGKWGGAELGIRSDLDFVFLTHGESSSEDAKAAKKFFTYITAPGRGGALFDIDLRLRPSGKGGPLLVSEPNLKNYLQTEAPFWLRQAYLKMRLLNNSVNRSYFKPEFNLTTNDLAELIKIKAQLIKPKTDAKIDLKYSPGGLLDAEFTIQWHFMKINKLPDHNSTAKMLEQAGQADPRWLEVKAHYLFLRKIEQVLKIISLSKLNELHFNSEHHLKLSKLLNASPQSLWDQIIQNLDNQLKLIKALNPFQQLD